jgi:serralysin
MAITVISADAVLSNVAIASGNTQVVKQGVMVTGTGDHIFTAAALTNNIHIAVYGTIVHAGDATIEMDGLSPTLTIGAAGALQALGASGKTPVAVHMLASTSSILNMGLIESFRVGIDIEGNSVHVANLGAINSNYTAITSTGSATVVDNSGLIADAKFYAVKLLGANSIVNNSGTISSPFTAITFGTNGLLKNTGTIHGDVVAANDGTVENTGWINAQTTVIASTGRLSITNTGDILSSQTGNTAILAGSGQINNMGQIVGGVQFTDALNAGFVTNGGAILGGIQFSNAGGVFTDAGGTVSGVIQGGSANDLFNVNSLGLTITDASGLDYDLVNASVDFTLGNGIEALRLFQNAVLGAGNDLNNGIEGNAVGNTLLGMQGADSVLGYGGADSILGGMGNDGIYGGDEDDTLNGGAQDDQVYGEDGSDVLLGMTGNDYIEAGADDDTLQGGTGNDSLYGGDGADVLIGGAGKDQLVGGADADSFVFAKGDSGIIASARDVVTGFTAGVDTIDLSRMDANTKNANPNDAFTFIAAGAFTLVAGQLHYVVSGGNILLEGDTNADGLADFQIQLNGIAAIAVGDLVL